MTPEEAHSSICQWYHEACLELFQDMNCHIERIEETEFERADIPEATIDGGCGDFEVLITMSLPFSTLAMTYPAQGHISMVDEAALEDWSTEISNRLLGKLKARLSLHGCELDIGLPEYSFGPGGRILHGGAKEYTFHFDVDSEVFETRLAIETFCDSIGLTHEKVEDESDFGSGDLEFF